MRSKSLSILPLSVLFLLAAKTFFSNILDKQAVLANGNEGGVGDIAMLKYSQGNKYPSLQLLVNHNDSIREYSYQEKDSLSLNAAAKNNWDIINMKADW